MKVSYKIPRLGAHRPGCQIFLLFPGQAIDFNTHGGQFFLGDLGIDFFDTADVYGCGYSERILGQALADRRYQVVVATKFGETFDEQNCQPTEEELNPAYIRRACEASLRRLNTDYIDLYVFVKRKQVHLITEKRATLAIPLVP